MKLTGKCKVDFEKWIYNNMIYCSVDDIYNWFLEVPQSMQYGVYVDYFDSVGMNLDNVMIGRYEIYGDKPKARIQAIEKANEIYNKK